MTTSADSLALSLPRVPITRSFSHRERGDNTQNIEQTFEHFTWVIKVLSERNAELRVQLQCARQERDWAFRMFDLQSMAYGVSRFEQEGRYVPPGEELQRPASLLRQRIATFWSAFFSYLVRPFTYVRNHGCG